MNCRGSILDVSAIVILPMGIVHPLFIIIKTTIHYYTFIVHYHSADTRSLQPICSIMPQQEW